MKTKQALAALAALAQETRLGIFQRLVRAGPTGLPAGEIGAGVKAAPATLSFHLKELAHAGLVESRQEGRFVFYRANYSRMGQLLGFLTENCCVDDPVSGAPSQSLEVGRGDHNGPSTRRRKRSC